MLHKGPLGCAEEFQITLFPYKTEFFTLIRECLPLRWLVLKPNICIKRLIFLFSFSFLCFFCNFVVHGVPLASQTHGNVDFSPLCTKTALWSSVGVLCVLSVCAQNCWSHTIASVSFLSVCKFDILVWVCHIKVCDPVYLIWDVLLLVNFKAWVESTGFLRGIFPYICRYPLFLLTCCSHYPRSSFLSPSSWSPSVVVWMRNGLHSLVY